MKTATAGFLSFGAIVLAAALCLPIHGQGASPPTPAQRLMGDVAPKLVELTDNVLFGDVWGARSFRSETAVSLQSVRSSR